MPYSEAQNKATQKYKAKAYERIEVTVKKGQKGDFQAQAQKHSMSLNAYIIALLEKDKEVES